MSPRKVRRVVHLIKGKSIDEALAILKFTNKAAAGPLMKTIQSATANALAIEGTSRLKAEDLSIADIKVDEGPRAKRIRFRAMGRVYRYKKRFTHLTVVVQGEAGEEAGGKRAKAVKTAKTAAEEPKKAAEKKAASAKKTAGKKSRTATKAKPKGAAGKKAAAGKGVAGKKAASKTAKKSAGGGAAKKSDK